MPLQAQNDHFAQQYPTDMEWEYDEPTPTLASNIPTALAPQESKTRKEAHLDFGATNRPASLRKDPIMVQPAPTPGLSGFPATSPLGQDTHSMSTQGIAIDKAKLNAEAAERKRKEAEIAIGRETQKVELAHRASLFTDQINGGSGSFMLPQHSPGASISSPSFGVGPSGPASMSEGHKPVASGSLSAIFQQQVSYSERLTSGNGTPTTPSASSLVNNQGGADESGRWVRSL